MFTEMTSFLLSPCHHVGFSTKIQLFMLDHFPPLPSTILFQYLFMIFYHLLKLFIWFFVYMFIIHNPLNTETNCKLCEISGLHRSASLGDRWWNPDLRAKGLLGIALWNMYGDQRKQNLAEGELELRCSWYHGQLQSWVDLQRHGKSRQGDQNFISALTSAWMKALSRRHNLGWGQRQFSYRNTALEASTTNIPEVSGMSSPTQRGSR